MSLFDERGVKVTVGDGADDDSIRNLFGDLAGFVVRVNGQPMMVTRTVTPTGLGGAPYMIEGYAWDTKTHRPDLDNGIGFEWDEVETLHYY